MSKSEIDLPERLRAAGATDLERRLLEAASRERPSPDLSERMARAIGISIPAAEEVPGEAVKAGKVAAGASRSLVPWLSGGLIAVVVGGFLAARLSAKDSRSSTLKASAPATSSPSSTVAAPATSAEAAEAVLLQAAEELPTRAPALPSAQRGRHGTEGELTDQIALVDAARAALAAGGAGRALAIVREYQTKFPAGTFRPEVAAVKIEALMKLGRTTEARTAAERFVVAYGPGPLSDRVARLAGLSQP